MPQRSAGSAILHQKCPRCREGDIFEYPLLQKPTQFMRTYEHCPHCQLAYEREPGFFIGAMYISYAFVVAVMLVSAFVLYYFFGDPDLWVYITIVPTLVVLLLPVIFRYSRTLYLHGFGGVGYNEEYR